MKRFTLITTALCLGMVIAACGAVDENENYIDPVYGEVMLGLSSSQCKIAEVGGPDACAEAAYWKKVATKTCGKSNLHVGKAALGESCGKGKVFGAKFQCCKVPELNDDNGSTDDITEITPEPAQKCFGKKLGKTNDKHSCRDAALYKAHAAKICAKAGGKITNFSLDNSCGKGKVFGAKFECCKGPSIDSNDDDTVEPVKPVDVTPAPAQKCMVQKAGGAKHNCQDAGYWKGYAYKSCIKAGGKLTALKLAHDCGKGMYQAAKFQCCKQAQVDNASDDAISIDGDNSDVDSVTEPQQKCFSEKVGKADSKASCKPAAYWKSYAYKTCMNAGGNITDFGLGQKCGDGMHTQAKFQCCKSAEKPAPSKPEPTKPSKPSKPGKDAKPAKPSKG